MSSKPYFNMSFPTGPVIPIEHASLLPSLLCLSSPSNQTLSLSVCYT